LLDSSRKIRKVIKIDFVINPRLTLLINIRSLIGKFLEHFSTKWDALSELSIESFFYICGCMLWRGKNFGTSELELGEKKY
jgi:hypothetical protein